MPWYRPAMVLALTAVGFLMALAAAALAVGRHSSAVAAPVGRILAVPGSTRFFAPDPPTPPFRYIGPSFTTVQSTGPVTILAFGLLLVALVALGLAFLYWSPWFGRYSKRRLG
jgi:hypothetical protein